MESDKVLFLISKLFFYLNSVSQSNKNKSWIICKQYIVEINCSVFKFKITIYNNGFYKWNTGTQVSIQNSLYLFK